MSGFFFPAAEKLSVLPALAQFVKSSIQNLKINLNLYEHGITNQTTFRQGDH